MKKIILVFGLILFSASVFGQVKYKVELALKFQAIDQNAINTTIYPLGSNGGSQFPSLFDVTVNTFSEVSRSLDEVRVYSSPVTHFRTIIGFSGSPASCFNPTPPDHSFPGSQCSFINFGFTDCVAINPDFNLGNKFFPLEDFAGLNPGSGDINDCDGKDIIVSSLCGFKYRLYAVYQGSKIDVLTYGEHPRVVNVKRTGNLTQIPYGQPFSLQVEYDNTLPLGANEISTLVTGQRFVPCAPELDGTVNPNPDPIAPTCVGDSDGGFDVTFDRVLRTDEKMSIFVHPGTTDPSIIDSKQNLEDSNFTGRTYQFLGTSLPAGSYRMSYIVGPIVPNAFPTVAGTTDGFFTITNPAPVTFTPSANNASCVGTADGSITVIPQGGTGPYQYLLTPNGGSETTYSTSPIPSLADGDYSLRVRDNNGCFSLAQNVSIQATSSTPVLNTTTTIRNQLNEAPLGQASIILGNISGGNGAFTYVWTRSPDNGFSSTSRDLTSLTEGGTYIVVITSGTCASQPYSFVINDIQPLTVSFSTIGEANCEGDTATIRAQGQGGTGSYTYLWDTGATSASINVEPGTYSVEVMDSSGTTTNDSFTLNYVSTLDGSIITNLLSVEVTSTSDVLCRGDNTGAIDLTITGGLGNYEVYWDGSTTISTQDRTDLLAGPHYYRVVDRNGCEVSNFTNQIIISEPTVSLEVTGTPTDVTTNGGTNGTIQLTITNGTPPFQYSWWKQEIGGVQEIDGITYNPYNPILGVNPIEFTGFSAGTYQVTVTDGTPNACTATLAIPIDIGEPGPLTINNPAATILDVACFGESTGRIDASYEGTAPFEFVWLDDVGAELKRSPDDFIENLPAGTYSYTINDASNAGPLPSGNIEIIQPGEALSATFVQTEVTCFGGNDGTITVSATGGTAPLQYLISGSVVVQPTPGSFTNLEAGNYTINVTDANGCSIPALLDVELVAPTLITFDDTNAVTPVSTPSGSDGAVSVTVQGGAQPYFYRWSGPAILVPINTPNTTTIQNLPQGVYTLEVSNKATFDIDGCYFTRQYTVTEQAAFSIQSFTGTPTCFNQSNGSLTATIVATGPITFNWTLEDDTIIATETTNLRTLSTQGLAAGNYYLEIVNAANQNVQSTLFEVVELPEVSATVDPVPTCLGSDTGSITFSNPIGSPSDTYSYSIDDGLTFQASPIFENLAAGTYDLRVSIAENNNCDFIVPGVTITTSPGIFWDEPNTLITRASGAGTNDGQIAPAFIGGTPPLTYLWSANANNATTQNITGLAAGIYTVTVTDAANCPITQNFEVTEVGPLTISNIAPTNVSCRGEANGSITTTVTGEGTITYLWTIANGDPVSISNGVNGANLTGILAGSYILTATDDNATVSTAPIVIGEPATSVTITNIIPTDISCFGGNDGALEIQAAGGSGPYTYSLNGGAFQTTPQFTGLLANSYAVIVRDANACEFAEPTPVLLIEPQELSLIINEQRPVTAANETNGAIFITVEGGSNNYTYEWSGPNGYLSTDEDILGLAAGDYIVTITDANFAISNGAGCRLTSAIISITEPGQLIANLIQTVLLECSGDAFAEITANVQGGVSPYTYEWFQVINGNNNLLNEDTDIIGSLTIGSYFVRATDANSITVDSNPIPITAPTLLDITIDNTTNVLCAGQPTGSINITVLGGTPPYQYFWSNSATVADISALDAGDYTVDVEDASGCIAQRTITISAPADAVQIADFTVNNVTTYQALDGSISVNISGGLTPYTYIWTRLSDNSIAGNQATISNLAADSYSVSISDANGCTVTETYEVTQPDIVEETIVQPSCTGESDGSISVLVNQGNGAFTYLWDTGATENNINNLAAGSYTVTVTGFANGPLTRTYVLENPVPLEVNLGVDRVLCAGQTLELDATVDDATASYSWTSDSGFTSSQSIITLGETGNYTVTVQSQTGCTTQGTIFVDISADEIDAQFAMSSQVFVGETVIAVDISFPIPEGIEWIVPIGAEVITQNQDAVEFSFAEAGEYDITIITTRGDCIAQKTKKVLVVAMDGLIQDDGDKTGQKLVEEFIVYPNPTTGRFTADINLTERGDVSVKIFNFANNAMMASERGRGEASYSIPFDISGMPSGVYAVLLETPYGTSLRKIVVR